MIRGMINENEIKSKRNDVEDKRKTIENLKENLFERKERERSKTNFFSFLIL